MKEPAKAMEYYAKLDATARAEPHVLETICQQASAGGKPEQAVKTLREAIEASKQSTGKLQVLEVKTFGSSGIRE